MSVALPVRFELDEGLDTRDLGGRFRLKGRLLVSRALTAPGAAALIRSLEQESRWRLTLSSVAAGRRVANLAGVGALGPYGMRTALDTAYLDHGAPHSHIHEFLSLQSPSQDPSDADEVYRAFSEFLRGDAFTHFVRQVTGLGDVRIQSPIATCYRPGHFYATHTDSTAGRRHVGSLVFNVAREWQAQWGGLLQFLSADGDVDEAYLPKYNSLSLFRADQSHGVTLVAPFASPRYSIAAHLVSPD